MQVWWEYIPSSEAFPGKAEPSKNKKTPKLLSSREIVTCCRDKQISSPEVVVTYQEVIISYREIVIPS